MTNCYTGYSVAPNGDVSINVTDDEGYYGYTAVIIFAEFARIAEESATAERGFTTLPLVRGMI
jgi:hypothetical protein